MYEINVSLHGSHLFATHPRSLTTDKDFSKALKIFMEKFPASEGYLISPSFMPNISYGFSLEVAADNDLLNKFINNLLRRFRRSKMH